MACARDRSRKFAAGIAVFAPLLALAGVALAGALILKTIEPSEQMTAALAWGASYMPARLRLVPLGNPSPLHGIAAESQASPRAVVVEALINPELHASLPEEDWPSSSDVPAPLKEPDREPSGGNTEDPGGGGRGDAVVETAELLRTLRELGKRGHRRGEEVRETGAEHGPKTSAALDPTKSEQRALLTLLSPAEAVMEATYAGWKAAKGTVAEGTLHAQMETWITDWIQTGRDEVNSPAGKAARTRSLFGEFESARAAWNAAKGTAEEAALYAQVEKGRSDWLQAVKDEGDDLDVATINDLALEGDRMERMAGELTHWMKSAGAGSTLEPFQRELLEQAVEAGTTVEMDDTSHTNHDGRVAWVSRSTYERNPEEGRRSLLHELAHQVHHGDWPTLRHWPTTIITNPGPVLLREVDATLYEGMSFEEAITAVLQRYPLNLEAYGIDSQSSPAQIRRLIDDLMDSLPNAQQSFRALYGQLRR